MLTRELIIAKNRHENISAMTKLNVWGNNLTDVSIISEMPRLEVISMPVNSLSTLRFFGGLRNLRELYLRKNDIRDLSELAHLAPLKNLEVLMLNENPVASLPFYREAVVKFLPSLHKLDEDAISPEERRQAQSLKLDLPPPREDPPRPKSFNHLEESPASKGPKRQTLQPRSEEQHLGPLGPSRPDFFKKKSADPRPFEPPEPSQPVKRRTLHRDDEPLSSSIRSGHIEPQTPQDSRPSPKDLISTHSPVHRERKTLPPTFNDSKGLQPKLPKRDPALEAALLLMPSLNIFELTIVEEECRKKFIELDN